MISQTGLPVLRVNVVVEGLVEQASINDHAEARLMAARLSVSHITHQGGDQWLLLARTARRDGR